MTLFDRIQSNLRESCLCTHCRASNRQRQLAMISAGSLHPGQSQYRCSLRRLTQGNPPAVYNTEAGGPIHQQLSASAGYVCSEYFGAEYRSGDKVHGVLHQDLQSCSFPDDSFDLVLSSDVLEHIPDPYLAHREIFRILKKGGRHVFTVPFYHTLFRDEVRAGLDDHRQPVYLKEPWYHDDPVRPNQGVLVFRVFALEMLVRLEEIGFQPRLYHLYHPWFGILGPNAIVFEAIK